ncbi:MAG TPA: hypothetical protein VKI19_05785, partial [Acidimicrobiales bacterium]|nr:hypothetical protein [Acidimicrobiales bacterium]
MTTVETLSLLPPDQSEPADLVESKTWTEQILLTVFLVVPFVAVLAAIPMTWGWGLTWRDVVIAVVLYAVSG